MRILTLLPIKITHTRKLFQTWMEALARNHRTDGNPNCGCWSKENYVMYVKETDACFNQRSGIIQSGLNAMQTTFVLEPEFADSNLQVNTLQANANGASGTGRESSTMEMS